MSAMSGETNRLLKMAHEMTSIPDEREMDVIAAPGEQISAALVAMAIQQEGGKARSLLGHQVKILTDGASALYGSDAIAGVINIITKMFTDPVLKVDLPRVEAELKRELDKREKLMYAAVNPADWEDKGLLKGKEKLLQGKDREQLLIKRVIGSNDRFAELLRAEDIEPPVKLSDAWMKLNTVDRELQVDKKWTYAFAKDDADFINLPNMIESWGFDLNDVEQVKQMSAKQDRLQALVDVRIAVKSTTNITRAQRFLTAGADDMCLPVGYAYSRAHTHRLGGNNKMNMQNLTRGGELRLSILAPKGHALCVQDSGQIEARVNGWLWGQTDLLDALA